MGRLSDSLFSSKFARRIFLLFISAAIVPVAAIATLSFIHVSNQLHKQSYEQSRQTSKAVGMEFFRRLTMAGTELERVAEGLRLNQIDNLKSLQSIRYVQLQNLTELAVIDETGHITRLQGEIDHIPVLATKQQEALALGKTVIHTRHNKDHAIDVLMLRTLAPRDPAKGVLIGRVSPDFLWSVGGLLTSSTELVVLGPSDDMLYSSQPLSSSLVPSLAPLLDKSISGHFEWQSDGFVYLASYWSVFTDADFSIPYLVMVVSQPETDVLEPIIGFSKIYIPILVLAVLAMSFVAARQIRRRMAPLVTLRNATRRIARGDFDHKVSITSDDEFAQLGEAFNSMANRLEKQFASLATMAEIDRLILSSFDARYIVDTVLGRARELTPCTIAAILELDAEPNSTSRISVRPSTAAARTVELQVQLSAEEIQTLCENPASVLIDATAKLPAYLIPLTRVADTHRLLLFPMFIMKRLAAVLVLGYAEQCPSGGFNEGQLRKLADHVAVALSNANWEERLYHQAHYDALTNLPNRALLKDRLEQAIARAQRNKCYVGVIFIDLDRFKLVNDSLGHDIGDQLLNNTARLLVGTVRNVDTVVRFGGDEFVIVIPDIARKGDVVSELGGIADKIIRATGGEFSIADHEVHSGMSIGISLYPKDGETPDELVKNADTAMYHAKEQGRDRYEFFAPELNKAALHRLNLEQELRRALDNDEFAIHYQSKVDSQSGRLVGVEALIRWRHPQKGLVAPLEFIAVAEETGLIRPIGDWVLSTVCHQMKAWRDTGLPEIRVAVNVSPRQFRENNFTLRVAEILEATRLAPGMLELEVTEGSLMEDIDDAVEKLNTLNVMGVHLSVDDFGTGYSSLSYLRQLPIHSLKIDQSFVLNMIGDQSTQAIVASTIYLAHQLGLLVVAEGVETEAQKKLLQTWGCDVLQGHLVKKPLPGKQFAKLLAQVKDEYKHSYPVLQ